MYILEIEVCPATRFATLTTGVSQGRTVIQKFLHPGSTGGRFTAAGDVGTNIPFLHPLRRSAHRAASGRLGRWC